MRLSRRSFLQALAASSALLSGCVEYHTGDPLAEQSAAAPPAAPVPPAAEPSVAEEPAPAEPSAPAEQSEEPAPAEESAGAQEPAEPASDAISVVDLHADTIDVLAMNAYPPYSGFSYQNYGTLVQNNAQLAAGRLGGFRWTQCFAIWIPDDDWAISHLGFYRVARDWFKAQMEYYPGDIVQARAFADIAGILDAGKMAAILTVENGAPVEEGLGVVDEFAADGVRVAGFTWNGRNALGSGNEGYGGLTELGRSYVDALEGAGIVADVSHLNEEGFWDVAALAKRPFIATHSNARSVCDHPRNLSDEQFKAIMDAGGLVGLNYHQDFVVAGGGYYGFDALVAHVEHWLDLGGEDCIGLGSDRDGATLPAWIAYDTSQGDLYALMVERLGQSVADKVFYQNAMAFFSRYDG